MEGGLSEVEAAAELLVAKLSAGASVADELGVSFDVFSRRICASVGVASAGCVSAGAGVAMVVTSGSADSPSSSSEVGA